MTHSDVYGGGVRPDFFERMQSLRFDILRQYAMTPDALADLEQRWKADPAGTWKHFMDSLDTDEVEDDCR